jgi:hypothetical protein
MFLSLGSSESKQVRTAVEAIKGSKYATGRDRIEVGQGGRLGNGGPVNNFSPYFLI